MEIGFRVESDHLPICIELEGKKGRKERHRIRKEGRKMQIWGEKEIENYKKGERDMRWFKEESVEVWSELKEVVKGLTTIRDISLGKGGGVGRINNVLG